MQHCRGERGQHHLPNLCYANSSHTGAQDLFIPSSAWIMPDLKQSILQTVAEWAGSMTYWGSNCPLMVTETESPVWSMPWRWSEIPMLAWEKTKGLQAEAICVGVLTLHTCPMVQRNMSWDMTPHSSCRAESVSLEATTQWHVRNTWRCNTTNIIMNHKSQNNSPLFLLEATKISGKNPKTRSVSDCGEGNSSENKPWEGRSTGERLLKWPTEKKNITRSDTDPHLSWV